MHRLIYSMVGTRMCTRAHIHTHAAAAAATAAAWQIARSCMPRLTSSMVCTYKQHQGASPIHTHWLTSSGVVEIGACAVDEGQHAAGRLHSHAGPACTQVYRGD